MTFEVNESIQVLDSTGVWRTGTILSKQLDKFIIHFQSLSSKHDIECSKDSIRKTVAERLLPRTSLKCKSTELVSLLADDKVIYNINGKEEEGHVLENDPFNCSIKIRTEKTNDDILYKTIVLTSKNSSYEKLCNKITNEPADKIEISIAPVRKTTVFKTFKKKPRYFYDKESIKTLQSKTLKKTVRISMPPSNSNGMVNTDRDIEVINLTSEPINRALNMNMHPNRPFAMRQPTLNNSLQRKARMINSINENASHEPLNFNHYLDNITSRISQQLDSIHSGDCLNELTKTICDSTNKITNSIDKLTSVISELIQNGIQSDLQYMSDSNVEADSSVDASYAPSQYVQQAERQQLSSAEQTEVLNQSIPQYSEQDLPTYSEPVRQYIASSSGLTSDNFNFEYLSQDDVANIKVKSKSAVVFSSNLMERLFSPNEFIGHNVNGRGMNKLDMKMKLDPNRINYIEKLVNKYFNPGRRVNLWPKCVKRMNRRILELCPANKNRRIRIKQDMS